VVAYRGGRPVRAGEFLADVARTVPALGDTSHVLNVCADRYLFAVGFAAGLVSGKVNLLPSTHTPEVIRQLRAFAPDVTCLSDEAGCDIDLPRVMLSAAAPGSHVASMAMPQLDPAQVAAYVFTSGSTGAPVPHRKTWRSLTDDVREEAARLGLGGQRCTVVATVPPQHMYGLETSFLLPLLNGHALCAERPFYPADIATVLAGVPRPRILASTPVHLRALMGSGVELPAVDLVVSATAPLAAQLALEVETRCHCQLLEIYGTTETGQIATRRSTAGAAWRLWPGIVLSAHGEETWAVGGHVEEPKRLYDVLEMIGSDSFLLHGRIADLVNIAGKRSSLAYLNHQLNSIPGVLDGAFFHAHEPDGERADVARVGACAVAPGRDAAWLIAQLRQRIDPVFLPRPLLLVEHLPRNATGKLPQAALQALTTTRTLAAPQSKTTSVE
jgi:acyl-coenzyme A synthetase/AMP-(fatty) acid ligase